MSNTAREFANYIMKELERIQKNDALSNGAGSARDWADYKCRVGRLKGLKRAHDLVNESVDKFLNDDEGGEI